MSTPITTKSEIGILVEKLKGQLQEAEQTRQAVHRYETNPIVVSGPEGTRINTLERADYSYRTPVYSQRLDGPSARGTRLASSGRTGQLKADEGRFLWLSE